MTRHQRARHPDFAALLVQIGASITHVKHYRYLQDIGFGGIWPEPGYDNNVINMYFDWYIPTGIRMGEYFKAAEGTEAHIYTMHSYIASLYMSCPPGMGLHCPSATEQQEFCQAARDGHISWTAFPYNAQVELMDEETILGALQLTHDLDHLCGVPVKTVISQVRARAASTAPQHHKPKPTDSLHGRSQDMHCRWSAFPIPSLPLARAACAHQPCISTSLPCFIRCVDTDFCTNDTPSPSPYASHVIALTEK